MVRKSDNHDLVLNAARACYLRVGVDKTTAADIASEAGISRATLYRRFSSHEDIFIAVLTRDSWEMAEACQARLEGIDDPVEHIVEGMLYVLDEIPRRPLHAHLFGQSGSPWVISRTIPAEKLHAICVELIGAMPGLRLLPQGTQPRQLDFLGEWILRTLVSYAVVPSQIARNRDEMRDLLHSMLDPVIKSVLGGYSGAAKAVPARKTSVTSKS